MRSELYEKMIQIEKQMDSLRVACKENKIGNEEFEVRKSGLKADNANIIRDYMAAYSGAI